MANERAEKVRTMILKHNKLATVIYKELSAYYHKEYFCESCSFSERDHQWKRALMHIACCLSDYNKERGYYSDFRPWDKKNIAAFYKRHLADINAILSEDCVDAIKVRADKGYGIKGWDDADILITGDNNKKIVVLMAYGYVVYGLLQILEQREKEENEENEAA